MRQIKVIVLLLIMTLLCVSCEKQESRYEYLINAEPEYLTTIVSESYKLKELSPEQTHLEQPNGILCRDQDILVCDGGRNSVVQLSLEGEFLGEIGRLGMGELEFNRPTGITSYQGHIYVIDSKNHRIQELNEDLTFLQSFLLPDFGGNESFYFVDIAIDPNGNIYASSNNYDKHDQLIRLSESNEWINISDSFVGFLDSYDGRLYGINSMELYTIKDGFGMMPGENKIYALDEKSTSEVAPLPFKYTAQDFIARDDCFYTLSRAWSSIDEFESNGTYRQTIVQFPDYEADYQYCNIDSLGNFWVTSRNRSTLYLIQKNEW